MPLPARPLDECVFYEMHVKGFTCHPSAAVAHPGTYRGVVEKIRDGHFTKENDRAIGRALGQRILDRLDGKRAAPSVP